MKNGKKSQSGGSKKFGGESPKFYLGIYLKWGMIGPGEKNPLINTLTCTLVKCDTPESISIPLTHKICV